MCLGLGHRAEDLLGEVRRDAQEPQGVTEMATDNVGGREQHSPVAQVRIELDHVMRANDVRKKPRVSFATAVIEQLFGQVRELGVAAKTLMQFSHEGFDARRAAEPEVEGRFVHVSEHVPDAFGWRESSATQTRSVLLIWRTSGR